jgi:hypothetical protein
LPFEYRLFDCHGERHDFVIETCYFGVQFAAPLPG